MAEIHGKIEVLSLTLHLNQREDQILHDLLWNVQTEWRWISNGTQFMADIFMFDNPDGLSPEITPEELKVWQDFVKELKKQGEPELAIVYVEDDPGDWMGNYIYAGGNREQSDRNTLKLMFGKGPDAEIEGNDDDQ